jgi:hypothetical protein
MAEAAHRLERGIEHRPADRVVNQVEAPAAGVGGHDGFHRLVAVDRRRAEAPHQIVLPGRDGGEDPGAEGGGQLHRDVADAAGAALDQHGLALAHPGAIDQPFPGGDRDQRQCRGLAHREIGRLRRQQRRIDRRVFGQRALMAADAARHAIDLVARPETRDAGADRRHRAGEVDAEHRRQRVLGMGRGAGADLEVERVDAARGDPHQHLALGRHRPRQLGRAQRLVRAVQHQSAHRGEIGHGSVLSVMDRRWAMPDRSGINENFRDPCTSV